MTTQVEMTMLQTLAQTREHHVVETNAWADEWQNQPRPPQRLLAAEGPPLGAADGLPQVPAAEREAG